MSSLPTIPSSADIDVAGRSVLLRVDINSPLDPKTNRIVGESRIDKSLPTIRDLSDRGARLTIMAHQGDALDYQNFIPTDQHAAKLSEKLHRPVKWIDDVAGPDARRRIQALRDGEILLLDNVRIHGEELSTFERDVQLSAEEMADTYLVRHLAPLFDLYVNDAFAAAHRSAPSMVAFQRMLPSAVGLLLAAELDGLRTIVESPARPTIFLLGGLKVSDGFSVMGRVLSEGLADRVLITGVLGEIFLLAAGVRLGAPTEQLLADRDLLRHVHEAAVLLEQHRDRIGLPIDVAVVEANVRREIAVAELPTESLIVDVGEATICANEHELASAGTIFVNGPAGAYETPGAEVGTQRLWKAVARADGMTAIGGGDTVASATRFISLDDLGYVSTAGGALIRFVSGQPLPLLEAFRDAVPAATLPPPTSIRASSAP